MSKNCNKIHQLFNRLPKFSFPFNEQEIPENGIYVLFQKGEFGHRTHRIVRIGTHTGGNNLKNRLHEHFLNKNKDRSIFMKHIGRAMLNKKKDYLFLENWEKDLTTKKAKEKHKDSIDFEKSKILLEKVAKYIKNNFNFVIFEVKSKKKRKYFEQKLISTIGSCDVCKPSKNWLGLFITDKQKKIKEKGLWNIQGYENKKNKLLSNGDMKELRYILKPKS